MRHSRREQDPVSGLEVEVRLVVERGPGDIVDDADTADFVAEGNTSLGGRLPINCDGGMVNVGRIHGVNHMVEVMQQLRGASGPRQTPNAEVGEQGLELRISLHLRAPFD